MFIRWDWSRREGQIDDASERDVVFGALPLCKREKTGPSTRLEELALGGSMDTSATETQGAYQMLYNNQ